MHVLIEGVGLGCAEPAEPRELPPKCWVSCWLPTLSWQPSSRAFPTEKPSLRRGHSHPPSWSSQLQPYLPPSSFLLFHPQVSIPGTLARTHPACKPHLGLCFLGQPTCCRSLYFLSTAGLKPEDTVLQICSRQTEGAGRVSDTIHAN